MKVGRQTTLRRSATLTGVGVHSGAAIAVTLNPAEANTGIVFVRHEADGRGEREVCAEPAAVTATEFATVIGDRNGPVVSTVEHVLAALYGLGVDNAVVEIDGPEVPIMDGSAAAFVEAVDAAGIVNLAAPRRYLQILKPVGVVSGSSYGELRPSAGGLRLEIEIDFEHPLVGRQQLSTDVDPVNFRRHLARARTFGFLENVERLWSAGYALGASLDNTLVVGEDRVLNPEGLRYPDEFVRHKALDALGDLALAGAPIIGTYRSMRGGHRLNYAVLCALLADPTAWAMVEPAAEEEIRRSPRVNLGHGERGLVAQPAFAPDVS